MTLKNTNASVRVKSRIDNDGEITETDSIVDAKFAVKNGKYYIIYKEDIVSDMSSCNTTLKIDENGVVSVKRTGAVNSVLVCETGKKHSSMYSFEFGAIRMETDTKSITNSLTPNGGELELVYDLEIGANKSKNRLNITVKEKINE